ncbi:AAA ATPase forming ring-shaped complexes-like [Zingiber officinale]|uniref:AAA ATPase forming ring-shaped complexes-like n=1 Tax=Zingiber officinale TaxID=94328 RepID=UPI001C4B3043|nr:AAA ATPase forming ring-shaped complexes-like [Zingiber officinale]
MSTRLIAKVLSVVGILQDEVDSMVSVMKVEKAPLESYVDIGGLDAQIQEIKEVVELPLTHPELYEDIGIRPPKGLAGFEMEVVKIEYAGHERELVSTVEINTYPDAYYLTAENVSGIVCVGRDGIVNELLIILLFEVANLLLNLPSLANDLLQ